jgi:hypothetical protein
LYRACDELRLLIRVGLPVKRKKKRSTMKKENVYKK